MWEKKLELYDKLVAKCPRFDRKGKTVPYTSANGHMFSMLNKDGQIGMRFSKQVQQWKRSICMKFSYSVYGTANYQ